MLGAAITAGSGIEDGMNVLDIVVQHPSTARFLAKKLAQRFVADGRPCFNRGHDEDFPAEGLGLQRSDAYLDWPRNTSGRRELTART